MRLAIDVSHWEDGFYDYAALKARGVEMVCAKATQGNYYKDDRYEYHTGGGKAAGMTTGAYLFYDPGVDPVRQVDYFIQYVSLFKPVDFFCLDIEKHTASIRDTETGETKEQRVSAVSLDAGIKAAYDYLRKKGKPVVIYTRKSWVAEYCPQMLKWVTGEPMWLAQYPDDHDRTGMTAQQEADWLAEINRLSFTWLKTDPYTNVVLWQFSQKYKCPGMGSVTDLDMILDDKKYDKWLGKEATTVPAPGIPGITPVVDRLPKFLDELRTMIAKYS